MPSEILEYYFFANTPMYLYKKLAGSDYVMQLSHKDESVLLEVINNANPDEPTTISNAYSALLALLKKNIDSSGLIQTEALNNLEWGNEMITIYHRKNPPTNHVSFKIPSMATSSNMKLTPYTITKVKEQS